MPKFLKQLIFIISISTIILAGGLAIYSANPTGGIKIDPDKTNKLEVVKQENSTSTNNNPVGWWKMDEGTASTSYDSSGRGFSATLTGGVQWVTGKLGKGLSFDGGNDYATLPSSGVLAYGWSALTVSAWVNTTDTKTQAIIAKGRRNSLPYIYNFYLSNLILNFTVGSVTATSSVALTSGWHNVVGVYDGSTIYVYIDGVRAGIVSKTGALGSTLSLHLIGASWYDNAITVERYFNGLIDDVRIYNGVLTSGEVAQMYNSTKDGYLGQTKVSTGLVGYWKLDENDATAVVKDFSGKNNNGTTTSGTATSTSIFSTTTAMIGRAMALDGSNDCVSISDNNSLDLTRQGTIEMWVFLNAGQTNYPSLIQKGSGDGWSSGTYAIFWHASNNRFIGSINMDSINYATFPVVSVGAWHHLAFTWNGSSLIAYVDAVAGTARAQTIPAPTNALSLWIGKAGAVGIYGVIDEVKIWNYAKTAEQIRNSYANGMAGLQ